MPVRATFLGRRRRLHTLWPNGPQGDQPFERWLFGVCRETDGRGLALRSPFVSRPLLAIFGSSAGVSPTLAVQRDCASGLSRVFPLGERTLRDRRHGSQGMVTRARVGVNAKALRSQSAAGSPARPFGVGRQVRARRTFPRRSTMLPGCSWSLFGDEEGAESLSKTSKRSPCPKGAVSAGRSFGDERWTSLDAEVVAPMQADGAG